MGVLYLSERSKSQNNLRPCWNITCNCDSLRHVADLNRDNFQDILVINGNNNTTGHQDSFIYWGGKEGWSPDRRTALPSLRGDHATIADWNADGFLDIAIGNRGDKPGEDQ